MTKPNPATLEGKAVIDLHSHLRHLEARTGEWPGADVVDILDVWLDRFDFFPDAETCAEANSSAVFHPMADPDDDGLPFVEVAGVLAFTYLDPAMECVRVSVRLDTTDEHLLRRDGAVPLTVEVGDTVVFSDVDQPSSPASRLVARLGRLAREVHDAAARYRQRRRA
ncbi:hypothetical protein [Streptomyces flavofungini]|uniref:Uncharacterized protein n=1 Tax=Streptomyces flavofungini TaxID=68200 RepID=A0ABS0XGK6_9ACTN|nr:hypothetical protein [Streptomyces flavofungini]MBJ3812315.1 hypothetical protein [Streptomyces flavofungini]GHC88507.1 hypothetical protein GCM10010349_75830 [Streptomyces flavofungini]